MKALLTMVAISAAALLLLVITPSAFAANGWGLEDPQLCVNNELLTVTGLGIHDGSVTVPKSATFSTDVNGCGGNDVLGVIPSEDVTVRGNNMLRVTVYADDGTSVNFTFGNQAVTDVVKNGSASAKFKIK